MTKFAIIHSFCVSGYSDRKHINITRMIRINKDNSLKNQFAW